MAEQPTYVGHAAQPLDMLPGTPLGGYAGRQGPSTSTLDPLEVAAIVVTHRSRTAVLCVADVPVVNRDVAEATRQQVAVALGADPALVWLTATHTHAGPETAAGRWDSATPEPWATVLPAAAAAAAERAARDAEAADVTLHVGDLVSVGGQRSGERRSLSAPVSVIAVRRPASGEVRGLFVVTACHPTVLNATNRAASADLNGAVRRSSVRRLPGAWAVAATGAAGDISTRPHRRGQGPGELDRLGRLAGEQVAALLATPPVARLDPSLPLVGAQSVIDLAARPEVSRDEAAATVARAEAAVFRARQGGKPALLRDALVTLEGAQLMAGAAADGSPVRCAVAALDLGGIVLLGIGAEPFSALRSRCGDALLVGYANGYCGYLPTEDSFGRDDYEVLICAVAAGQSERAVDAARALLR